MLEHFQKNGWQIARVGAFLKRKITSAEGEYKPANMLEHFQKNGWQIARVGAFLKRIQLLLVLVLIIVKRI